MGQKNEETKQEKEILLRPHEMKLTSYREQTPVV